MINGKFDFDLKGDKRKIERLQGFDQIVAIVAYDEPTEQVQQYAPTRSP